MTNERGVDFTPSPDFGATTGSAEFTAAPGLGDRSAGEALRAQADSTLGQAKEQAQQLVGSARQQTTERVYSGLDAQKHRAADSLSSVAQTLRTSGQQLQGQQDGVSQYLNQAADRVEELAHYLHDREVGELVETVEDFARRQPVAFLGGAFALGVLGARFLRSSRQNLVRGEVRERWSTRELTSRVDNVERDSVGRPNAPGYAPPTERSSSEYKAAGPRDA